MKPDPIVAEIRRNSERLLKRVGGTMEALVRYLQEREKAHPERVVDRSRSHRNRSQRTKRQSSD